MSGKKDSKGEYVLINNDYTIEMNGGGDDEEGDGDEEEEEDEEEENDNQSPVSSSNNSAVNGMFGEDEEEEEDDDDEEMEVKPIVNFGLMNSGGGLSTQWGGHGGGVSFGSELEVLPVNYSRDRNASCTNGYLNNSRGIPAPSSSRVNGTRKSGGGGGGGEEGTVPVRGRNKNQVVSKNSFGGGVVSRKRPIPATSSCGQSPVRKRSNNSVGGGGGGSLGHPPPGGGSSRTTVVKKNENGLYFAEEEEDDEDVYVDDEEECGDGDDEEEENGTGYHCKLLIN